jgi:hypothetical protein
MCSIVHNALTLSSYFSAPTCITVKGHECAFPYIHSDGITKNECFQKPGGDRFKSHCYTRVDPKTRRPDPSSVSVCSYSCPLAKYHTHAALVNELNDLAFEFPQTAETFNLGSSQRSEPLYGVR